VAKIILGSHAQVNKDFLGGVDPGKPLPVNGSEQTRQHGVDHDAMTTTGLGREVTKKKSEAVVPGIDGCRAVRVRERAHNKPDSNPLREHHVNAIPAVVESR